MYAYQEENGLQCVKMIDFVFKKVLLSEDIYDDQAELFYSKYKQFARSRMQ